MPRLLVLIALFLSLAGISALNTWATPCSTTDPAIARQWNLSPDTYGIGCPNNWGLLGDDVVIGIIGTGVQYDLKEFGDFHYGFCYIPSKYYGGWDYQNNDPEPLPDPGRIHETQCASVALACTNNKNGIAGVAGGGWGCHPGASLYVARLDEQAGITPISLEEAIVDAVIGGCDVISLSLGFGSIEDDENLGYPWEDLLVLRHGIIFAYVNGVNVVNGKGYEDSPCKPHYPADFDDKHCMTGVGAYGRNGLRWTHSGCGYGIDLSAPGEDVPSLNNLGQVAMFTNTSAATPHVAGAMAIVRSTLEDFTDLQPEDVESILKYSATDPVDPAYPGESDGDNWTWDAYYGHGRLNLEQAVVNTSNYDLATETAVGGTVTRVWPAAMHEFSNEFGGPLDGSVLLSMYEVQRKVIYTEPYASIPYVWGVGLGENGSTGWSTPEPNYQLGYTEVVRRSLNSCKVKTYLFRNVLSGAWYPCAPNQVRFKCRVWGELLGPRKIPPELSMSQIQADQHTGFDLHADGATGVAFTLEALQHVSARIVDVNGRSVRILMTDELLAAGDHSIVWDGRDNLGVRSPAGIYFCHVSSAGVHATRKLILLGPGR